MPDPSWPGGYELRPRRDYLAEAETWQEARRRIAEGPELLNQLNGLDIELREQYQAERRLTLRMHEARQRRQGDAFYAWETTEQKEADELLQKLSAEHEELRAGIAELEKRREEIARRLAKNFLAVGTVPHRKVINLDPPNRQEIQDAVGTPVGGW